MIKIVNANPAAIKIKLSFADFSCFSLMFLSCAFNSVTSLNAVTYLITDFTQIFF
jgi:hypothetical protein